MGKALLLAFCYRDTVYSALPEDLILADLHHVLRMYNKKFKLHHKDIMILTDLPLKDRILTKLYTAGHVKIGMTQDEIKKYIWRWSRSLKSGSNNFFYFTGHGGNYGGKDRVIFTSSFYDNSFIPLSDIRSMFMKIRKNTDVLCIFDCCLIGNGLRLPMVLYKGEFTKTKGESYQARILSLSSSKKDEYSRFTARGSIFTTFFTECVDKYENTKDIYICVDRHDGDEQTMVVACTQPLGLRAFV